jgi:hypothetical protein
MAEINYLDFDLLIERAGNKYQARVVNSPAGQASAAFRLPFSNLELENFLLRVGRTRRGVRRLESPEMEAAKTFGGRLFETVFADEVRACLRSSLDEASRQGAGLRIRLRLAAVPELADLPWEYLYNPALNRFLTLSAETPVVRYLDLPERIQPLPVKPPLRVLVMIASPSDYPALDVEQEWRKLSEALDDLERRGLVALERLEESTLAALQRRLRQAEYHIFHFIGHGGFDQQAQDGVLVMEDEAGRGRQVSGNYLGTLLHDERTLRLAILNACEGARASRTDPFAGTAQSLVQQGVPAVIAMQFEITDEAAITLAQEFYSAVADGYSVDAALAEARKAIFAQGNDVEWGTPVLYLRSPDGRIFDVEKKPPLPPMEKPIKAERTFPWSGIKLLWAAGLLGLLVFSLLMGVLWLKLPSMSTPMLAPPEFVWDFTPCYAPQNTLSSGTQIFDPGSVFGGEWIGNGCAMRFLNNGAWMTTTFTLNASPKDWSPQAGTWNLTIYHLSSSPDGVRPGYSPVRVTINGITVWSDTPGGYRLRPGGVWPMDTVRGVTNALRQGSNTLRWDFLSGWTTHYWLKSFRISWDRF